MKMFRYQPGSIKTGSFLSLFFVLLGGTLLLIAYPAWGATIKIGIVDLQRALNESIAGKQAAEELKRFRDQIAQQIEQKRKIKEQKEAKIKQLQQELNRQGLVLSEQAKMEKEETYRREVRELRRFIEDSNRFVEDSNRELQEKEAQLRIAILTDLSKIIEKIGKEDKFSLILEKNDSLLLYAADTIDLTEIVIKQYNAQSQRK